MSVSTVTLVELVYGAERSAKTIVPYDAMIAGHARSRGLILVTNNTREFNRVPGLRIENWI